MASLGSGLAAPLGADDALPVTVAVATLVQPRDLALNLASSELAVVGGDLQLVGQQASIAQDIQLALKLWLGEYVLDLDEGVDYLNDIFEKTATEQLRRTVLRSAILARLGVV